MAITPHFTIFLAAALLLLCTGTLAAPTNDTIPTIKAPEIDAMIPYFTQLMESIPILPPPQDAASLTASRKLIEDAIADFNLKNSHLLSPGEGEVTPAVHRICDTSGASPNAADAVAAANVLYNRGGRCVMNRRCTEFSTWGEAAVGACAGGFQLWDFDCRTVWRWVVGVCFVCSSNFGDVSRTGGRFVYDDGSGSDVRVYRN